jgi:hypothetical protein
MTIKANDYPAICVSNAIKWFNMSRSEWSTEMEKYDFSATGFTQGGAPYYSSGSDLNDDGVLYSITKDFDMLEIGNTPVNDYKKNIFNNIINELERYHHESKGNLNFFRIKYSDNKVYQFAISQDNDYEAIFLLVIK